MLAKAPTFTESFPRSPCVVPISEWSDVSGRSSFFIPCSLDRSQRPTTVRSIIAAAGSNKKDCVPMKLTCSSNDCCSRCGMTMMIGWMMMMMMMMISRHCIGAFPPRLIYSSIRRPLRTWLHRGGATSFLPTTITTTTSPSILSSSSSLSLSSSSSSSTTMSQMVSSATDAIVPTTTTTTASSNKLTILRDLMKERNIDVYLIPSDDPHLSGKVRSDVLCVMSLVYKSCRFFLTLCVLPT